MTWKEIYDYRKELKERIYDYAKSLETEASLKLGKLVIIRNNNIHIKVLNIEKDVKSEWLKN